MGSSAAPFAAIEATRSPCFGLPRLRRAIQRPLPRYLRSHEPPIRALRFQDTYTSTEDPRNRPPCERELREERRLGWGRNRRRVGLEYASGRKPAAHLHHPESDGC